MKLKAFGAGGSGGMEYPTFITAMTSSLFNRWPFDRVLVPEEVTVHEFGHQYWQSMVASNEFEESWLDEGFNSYSTGKVIDRVYGPLMVQLLGLRLGRLEVSRAQNSVERIFDFAETNALPESLRWIKTKKTVADKYGVKLIAYEAGQHLVGVGGGVNNEALTKLLIEANRHPRMGQLYTAYLDGWRDAGDDLCCLFSSGATHSKWGSWGVLEHARQTAADSPKFKAVMEWKTR